MSNENANSNSSFSHAFLPGLILGLIIGAVAGAFLPDLLGGPKIPAATSSSHSGNTTPRDREGEPAMTDEQIQELIDEAENQTEDVIDDMQGTIDDAAEEVENNLPTPPSDG